MINHYILRIFWNLPAGCFTVVQVELLQLKQSVMCFLETFAIHPQLINPVQIGHDIAIIPVHPVCFACFRIFFKKIFWLFLLIFLFFLFLLCKSFIKIIQIFWPLQCHFLGNILYFRLCCFFCHIPRFDTTAIFWYFSHISIVYFPFFRLLKINRVFKVVLFSHICTHKNINLEFFFLFFRHFFIFSCVDIGQPFIFLIFILQG